MVRMRPVKNRRKNTNAHAHNTPMACECRVGGSVGEIKCSVSLKRREKRKYLIDNHCFQPLLIDLGLTQFNEFLVLEEFRGHIQNVILARPHLLVKV